jgi:hypothetical protein
MHLTRNACVALTMVDTFANVQRIQRVIEELDVGEPLKFEKCETLPQPPRENR